MSDEILIARAYLSRVAEPTCIPLWAAVREQGPVAVATSVMSRTASPDVLAATAARAERADGAADIDVASRHGARLVVPESDEWPHFAFACLERAGDRRLARWSAGDRGIAVHGEPIPPLALWVRGSMDVSTLGIRSVGIVGSRSCTPYGDRVAAELADASVLDSFEVVSGGAFGIDVTAHRAAIRAGGRTVLVSAGGLDKPYPAAHERIYEQAAETGLVISESAPGEPPKRHRFLTRNRLIAALSTGTVIVEAALRSGAMNTAGHCRRLGRPLLVVPGPVTSPLSAGCHQLLAEQESGTFVVTSLDAVPALLGGAADLSESERTSMGVESVSFRTVLDHLDPVSRQVVEALRPIRYVSVDELAFSAGLSPRDVIRSMPALELSGLAEPGADGFRLGAIARQRNVT